MQELKGSSIYRCERNPRFWIFLIKIMASGKELRFLEIGIVFIYVLLFESFLYSFLIKMKEKNFF